MNANGKLHILIVDDDGEMCALLKDYLQSQGHDTEAYNNPADGLARVQLTMMAGPAIDRPIDMIICDLKMPEINGLQFAELSRRLLPDVPLILITAFATLEHFREAFKAGINDVIPKPFSLHEIDMRIAQIQAQEARAS